MCYDVYKHAVCKPALLMTLIDWSLACFDGQVGRHGVLREQVRSPAAAHPGAGQELGDRRRHRVKRLPGGGERCPGRLPIIIDNNRQ